MKTTQILKTALSGLKTNKSRSALTILGIVIGITAIILVMAIGRGAENLILAQIQGLGSKTIVVIPGREPTGPTDVAQLFSDSLKEKDLEALRRKENVPTLSEVMPVVFGGESASYRGETYRVTILGGTELSTRIFDAFPVEGIFFTNEDVKARADVVVIGVKVKNELFGENPALGEKIRIKDKAFRIIGIYPEMGQVSFFNIDESVAIPYTTAQQFIFGIKYFHRLIVEAESEDALSRTVRDIEITLRNSHDITDPKKDDFFVQTPVDLALRIGTVTGILTALLLSVAGISLVVGGIGIMNIMLVSVTERTREIGLRKAIGATRGDIMKQFLIEAMMLTAVGGVIGIILGAVFSFAAALVLQRFVAEGWVFAFPVSAAVAGILVSSSTGLVFGLYPARRAALKDPIEALRYE